MSLPPDVRAFFLDRPAAEANFERLRGALEAFGPMTLAATKSRVSFVRRTRFCWVHEANRDGAIWIGFHTPWPLDSPRLRSGTRSGRWSHHARLAADAPIDDGLLGWLRAAYEADGVEP